MENGLAQPKKAVLYLRVSTEEQVDNFSLGTQEQICLQEAQRRNMEVIQIFKEEGRSAKTITGRPVLIELLEFCRKNKRSVQAVIVYRLDRMSRQTADYLAIRKKLAEYGIALISATEPTGNSPTNKLVETMLAAFGQLDNDVRSERTKNGMRARFLAGLNHGPVALGYRSENGYTVKDPKTFDKVKDAWELMATGTKSLREMATIMNEWGIKQKLKGKEYPMRLQNVSRLFKNKFYIGLLVSEQYPEEVIGQHPPMISKEMYYKVQAILAGRNTNIKVPLARKNRDNPEFPLRRIIKCSKCGAVFTGAWSKGKCSKYAYYFCRNRCGYASVPIKDLNDAMLERMEEIKPTAEALTLFISLLRKTYYKRIANLQKRKDEADVELAKLYSLRQALIEKNLLGVYSDDIFKEQNKAIEERVITAQLSKSDALIDKYNLEKIIAFIKEKFAHLAQTYDDARLPAKRVLLCSIYPSGLSWEYPGYSNTEISAYYQAIRDPEVMSVSFGEPGENRTLNHLLKREMLCQLSYRPEFRLLCASGGNRTRITGFEDQYSIH